MNFTEWMRAVDKCLAPAGCSHRDLPDVAYRDMFEDECEPSEAAMEALYEAGAPDSLMDELGF
jgi:hypothetical protein